MKRTTTLILTAIAGYIDTLTFVSAGAIFAAHVTGNFVLFGASLARGVGENDFIKLIAFPVFVLFVGVGALVFGKSSKAQWRLSEMRLVLLVQALFFLVTAAMAVAVPQFPAPWLAMVLVAAMGLQNSLHRYVPGPMTTVMTGTVMNWAAARMESFFRLPLPDAKPGASKPFTGWMILTFAFGCVLGGFAASYAGLAVSVLPGIVLLVVVMFETKKA